MSDEFGTLLLLDAESKRLLSSSTETVVKALRQLVRTASWYFNCLFGILAIVWAFSARRHDYTTCTAPMGVNVENLITDCVHPPMHYDVVACTVVVFAVAGILVSTSVGRLALRRLRVESVTDDVPR